LRLTYMVETDWAVHWLRGRKLIVERLKELDIYGLGLSIISLAELYTGMYRSDNISLAIEGMEEFLSYVTVLNINDDICRRFGEENARLREKGKIIEDFDLMIAATCLHYDLKLLTNNRRHFERIEGLEIISVDY
jgi:tRNA(fMet)-specific endonuclease VapC